MPWYSSWRLQGSIVIVSSFVLRTRSPELMSLVQVAPLLAWPAKGLLSVAACAVHVPPRDVAVNERKYRPTDPMHSTIIRYWVWPETVYTWTASNRSSVAALMTVVYDVPKLDGNWPMGILDR